MLFQKARFKLTLYYVAIIMVISFAFSAFVYRGVMNEMSRGFRLKSLRGDVSKPRVPDWIVVYGESIFSLQAPTVYPADQELFDEIRTRIIIQLAFVNAVILIGSSLAGYFLSGKTLQPIEQMVEDQKHFIADASHELRTPLTAMKTEIEVSLRDKKLTLSDARELLQSNLEEVNKMQSLSNYLLSLAKYEKGDKTMPRTVVHLNKVISKVIERTSPLAASKNITIESTLLETPIKANETSMEELFGILLDNAIKYTESSGVITIVMRSTKTHLHVSITDTGVGIRKIDLPHIFKRFYRADTSRTKLSENGYGLGLSIAKSIVDLHNGKISVNSTPKKGSTFTVTLPRS